MSLKFFYNGIKDNGGKLQTCFYSKGTLINYPVNTLTIYKKEYADFTAGIREAFTVQNDTEIETDYIVQDLIRVEPTHPLYAEVLEAYNKQEARRAAKMARKGIAA